MKLRTILRDPLVHFLLIGAALFAIGWGTTGGGEPRGTRVVVSEGEIGRLMASFSATWNRPPSVTELEGLIEDFVREEIYYREALALGLDQDDIIIRRRLRQKMEFLSQDVSEVGDPTDEELQAYLDANSDRYMRPARYSFEQAFVATDDRTEAAARREAEVRLEALRNGAASLDLTDPTLLPAGMDDAPATEVARVFGENFTAALSEVPTGEWVGPLASGYGLHLVRVSASEPGRVPSLDEVRPFVERDWRTDREAELEEETFASMRERYTVVVERPEWLEAVEESPATGTAPAPAEGAQDEATDAN